MFEVGAILVAGVLATAAAVWGVVSQRSIARCRATIEFIARSEADGDLIQARRAFIQLAKAPSGLAVWAAEDKEQTEQAQAIKLVLNEFELISIGIQGGIIDFELYKRWHRQGTLAYWRNALPFIAALRDRTGNAALFHEFEEMVGWMKEEKLPRRSWKERRWW